MLNINTIEERAKYLRKNILENTQEAFAKKINLKRNTIAIFETGKQNISDRTIADICREFEVNEDWLRYGEGDIFKQKSDDEINALVEKYKLDDISKNILSTFVEMNENERAVMNKFLDSLASKKLNNNSEVVENIENIQYVELSTYENVKASVNFGSYLDGNVKLVTKIFKATERIKKADHAIVVNDNSMEPILANDEIIFVQEQTAIENSEIGIFVYNGEIYVKRLILDDNKIILRSENKKYNDIIVDKSLQFIIIGKVLL